MWRVSASPSPAAQARGVGENRGHPAAHGTLSPPAPFRWQLGRQARPVQGSGCVPADLVADLKKTFRPAVPTPARQGLLLLFSRPPALCICP